MRLERYCIVAVLLLGLFFSACEKRESPVALPSKTSAKVMRVDMGDEYENQVFFDFESGQTVMTSKINSWDFAFEASPGGYHVFMNGSKNLFVFNTHNTDPAVITEAVAYQVDEKTWSFDSPSGMPDSTGVGEWRDLSGKSKQEVYIIKFNDGSFKKFVVSSVNDSSYVFKYGDINSTSLNSINLPKNESYNFTYFSFDDGGKAVMPEPPKNTWDIVFTRYRYIYYDLENMPYGVTGVLLNPYNTAAMPDSTTAFESITFNGSIVSNAFSNRRDAIGFDWKEYSFSNGRYETNPQKCYVVKTRKDQYYKIHFIDFYSATGAKGSPSFEYDRIY